MAAPRTTKGTRPSKTSKVAEAPEPTSTVRPSRSASAAEGTSRVRAGKERAGRGSGGVTARGAGSATARGAGGITVSRIVGRLRPILLLGAVLGCVYATVALASYNPLDPSFSRASGSTVTNAAGPVGAWVADLLFQVLGLGAWSVVPLALALALLLAQRPVGGLVRATGSVALLWATLGMVASVWPALPGVDFPRGGLLGEVTVQTLRGLVGPAGTWIVLVGVALASVPFVAPLRLEDLAARLVGGVEGAAPKVGRAGVHLGRRAVGGVAAAGAAVVERVRVARAEEAEDWFEEEEGEQEEAEAPIGGSPGPWADEVSQVGSKAAPRPTSAARPEPAPERPLSAPPVPVRPTAGARVGDRPTAWNDGAPSRLASGLGHERGGLDEESAMATPATPTFASGRALVEVEWEATVAPDEGRDTVPAVDLVALSRGEGPAASPTDLPEAAALVARPSLPAAKPGPTSAVAASAPRGPAPFDAPDPASLAGRPATGVSLADELDEDDEDDELLPPIARDIARAPAPATPPPASTASAPPGATRGGSRGSNSRRVSVTPGQLVSGGEADGPDLFSGAPASPFELPHLGLLDAHERDIARFDEIELQQLAQTLEAKLGDFGVKGEVVAIRPGPVVTTFEYVPAPGIKLSKISGLSDDVAMALKALRVRIVAPIPGKGVVGIEIPNRDRQTVWLRDMLASETFRRHGGALPMVLGKTVEGKPYVGNLASMPHLLVGGTTGSGKSVGVNAMLLSMLYTRTPEELRLILIDPKMLEFELYRDIPHLLHPVVTEPKLASAALKWACVEMDERYRILSRWGVRNISSFNKKVESELADWTVEKAWRYAPADWPGDEAPPVPRRMPYIVIVIDELADLMMVAAKDVEESIIRLAQKARAAGIHLIVATQRPSVNVITGLIKANMPSRIAFQVRTKVDGRTILDQNGAENLLGKGDLLFLPPGVSDLERVHGPFVSDEEVRRVTDFLRDQGSPHYEAQITADDEEEPVLSEDEYDDLYDVAVAYVCRQGKASASMIQREFKIGYNRAARILEFMEREGVVGPADGARPREVLVGSHAS